jgi:hypothetical protein
MKQHPRVGLPGILAFCVLIAGFLPSPALAQNVPYGAVTGAGIGDCTKNVELGVGSIRAGFDWEQLQPNGPGTINWTAQDAQFDCFTSHGIKIFWTLAYAPAWARPAGSDRHRVPDQQAWAEFVRQAVTHNYDRYGGNITFGIWNEPEGDFLNGCPSTYINNGHCWGVLLWAPAQSVRIQYAPGARLAGPEMGVIDSRYDWAITMMAGGIQPQDVITTHWYSDFQEGLNYWMDTTISKAGGRETWLTETGSRQCTTEGEQASRVGNVATNFDQRYNYAWTKMFVYVVAQNNDCLSLVRNDGSNKPAFSTYKSHIPASPPPSGAGILNPGQSLNPGQTLASPNGRYVLKYQTDANLVLYDNGAPVWAINCWPGCMNIGAAGVATMQTDGNFVVYNSGGSPVWHTYTNGNPGAHLAVQDDSNLIVYSSAGSALWSRW